MHKELNSFGRDLRNIITVQEFNSGRSGNLLRFLFDRLDRSNIYVFTGGPTAGKSYSRKRFVDLVGSFYPELIEGLNVITWEEDGESAAKREGLIAIDDPQQPYSEQQIAVCNEVFEYNAAQKIKNGNLTVIETPFVTALRVQDRLEGRNLGYSMLSNLCKDEGEFKNLPHGKVLVTSLVPGYLQRVTAPFYRHGIKNAANLEEAREIARIFGRKPFASVKDWEQEMGDGASLYQILYLQKIMYGLLDYLPVQETQGSMITLSMILSDIRNHAFPDVTANKSYSPIAEFYLIDHQLETLGIDRKNTLVAVNGPKLRQLNISDRTWRLQTLPYIARVAQSLTP